VLRTPFQRVPPVSGEDQRIAALHGIRLPKQLGYGLDICREGTGKVLNIEWGPDGAVGLRSFRRGDWEAEILRLASCLPLETSQRESDPIAGVGLGESQ
jgi:hypothetical protein